MAWFTFTQNEYEQLVIFQDVEKFNGEYKNRVWYQHHYVWLFTLDIKIVARILPEQIFHFACKPSFILYNFMQMSHAFFFFVNHVSGGKYNFFFFIDFSITITTEINGMYAIGSSSMVKPLYFFFLILSSAFYLSTGKLADLQTIHSYVHVFKWWTEVQTLSC